MAEFSPTIHVERVDGVALVTIDRPAARNAIDATTAAALGAAVEQTEADPDIMAVVLTGSGRVFCSGADLKVVARGELSSLYTSAGGFAGFVDAKRTKPWIAAVNGLALAGGCEIALACDMIVASEDAAFGLPEVTRGLIAAAGGLSRLPRALPRRIAIEMIVTGARLPANRAAELGMVNRLAPAGQAVAAARGLAEEIARNAPLAVRASLTIARSADDLDEAALNRMSLAAQDELAKTEDFAEGARAFIEKREPQWKGR